MFQMLELEQSFWVIVSIVALLNTCGSWWLCNGLWRTTSTLRKNPETTINAKPLANFMPKCITILVLMYIVFTFSLVVCRPCGFWMFVVWFFRNQHSKPMKPWSYKLKTNLGPSMAASTRHQHMVQTETMTKTNKIIHQRPKHNATKTTSVWRNTSDQHLNSKEEQKPIQITNITNTQAPEPLEELHHSSERPKNPRSPWRERWQGRSSHLPQQAANWCFFFDGSGVLLFECCLLCVWLLEVGSLSKKHVLLVVSKANVCKQNDSACSQIDTNFSVFYYILIIQVWWHLIDETGCCHCWKPQRTCKT